MKPMKASSFLSLAAGATIVGISWWRLWTTDSYWNPVFFTALWVGAALVMYQLGREGYPGIRVHLLLALASMPVWWWFEFVNARVRNWEYFGATRYNDLEYAVFTTLAFSTVVPALHAAWRLMGAYPDVPQHRPTSRGSPMRLVSMLAVAAVLQMLLSAFPAVFYPLVWIAPFIAFDALVHYLSGESLLDHLLTRRWGLPLRIAAAGLLCGFLWELWNWQATPSWAYDTPGANWGHIFAMPVLGYGGYIPFAWSIFQLVQIGRLIAWRWPSGQALMKGRDLVRSAPARQADQDARA